MYSWNSFYFPNIDEDSSILDWYKYVYYPTYNRLDGLLCGVSIAGIYQFLPKIWSKITKFGNHFLILSLVILSAAYILCEDAQSYEASIFGFPLVALGYGFMVIGAVSSTSFLYKWKSKITTHIATLSYALYLTHKGIIHLVQLIFKDFNREINDNLMLCTSIFFCIFGAIIVNLIIEKPFLKLRNVLIKQKY
jgi:peptidoglycan/LPS O-acetylase OafA/YrhL